MPGRNHFKPYSTLRATQSQVQSALLKIAHTIKSKSRGAGRGATRGASPLTIISSLNEIVFSHWQVLEKGDIHYSRGKLGRDYHRYPGRANT